jgi:hypothetical protein
MKGFTRSVVLAGGFLFAWGAPATTEEPVGKPMKLERGMEAEQVRAQLGGPPRRIARQILYHRYLEQWIYDTPPLRLEFDCPRGQRPRLSSWRELP